LHARTNFDAQERRLLRRIVLLTDHGPQPSTYKH
jgi:hypothetical protein